MVSVWLSMSTDWIMVGYPLSKPSKTHIFIEDNGAIVQRCDMGVTATEGDVCKISDEELRGLLEKDDTEFCGECIRFMSHVAPM